MAHSVLLAAGILVTQQMNMKKKEHNDNVRFYIAVFENSPVDRANYIVLLSKCAPHSAENGTNLLMDGRDCIIQTTPSRQLPYTGKAT